MTNFTQDADTYGAGMEDVRADDAVEAGSSWTSHLPLTSGGKLLDFVSVESSNNNHKSRRASAGAKGGGAAAADVGVKGNAVLPRAAHRAWVSRIAADQRPSHRYKHMATVARLGTRYVVAWQASAVYEGHSDQRVYHTFSRDSAGTSWGPEHTIPAIERGVPQWSPVLHVDEVGGRLIMFYSESALCIRPPPGPDEGNPQAGLSQ